MLYTFVRSAFFFFLSEIICRECKLVYLKNVSKDISEDFYMNSAAITVTAIASFAYSSLTRLNQHF